MPANKPFIPQYILDFIDHFNFFRRSDAAEGIDNETRTLTGKIESPNAIVKDQPEYFMKIHPGEANLVSLLTRQLARQPHDHPMKALDIGTFTGRSALAIAEAMPKDGKVITCEVSSADGKPKPSLQIAEKYWKQAGVSDRIDLRVAKATDTIDQLMQQHQEGTFDLVFIDADKGNYDNYYEAALKLLRPGGIVLIDNTLWSGRVAQQEHQDPETNAIRTLDEKVRIDPRVDATFLEVEDGIIIAEKLHTPHNFTAKIAADKTRITGLTPAA